MIPRNLEWAFQENRRVRTPAGKGRTRQRRLADLVLPSGRLTVGLPGDGIINQPSEVQPKVLPGVYPVWISIAKHGRGRATVAFVVVKFTDAETVSWEEAGEFFTDSGDGCICDTSVANLLRAKKDSLPVADWQHLKNNSLKDGDGNLTLDVETGANAIVFRTCDWTYECFIGHSNTGQVTCLVVDGRA
jgi:hypothetical protein